MEYKLDEKDLQILDILKKKADQTTSKISKELNIPITTVHHRIQKMKKAGVIKNYTVNIDFKKIGYQVSAYILIQVNYDQLKAEGLSQHELVEKLKKHPEIVDGAILTGDTDIIVKVRTKTIDDLDNFIVRILRNISGISKTKTLVVLNDD